MAGVLVPFLLCASEPDESLRCLFGVLKLGFRLERVNKLWLLVFSASWRDARPSDGTSGESCSNSSLLHPVYGDHLYLPFVVRIGDLIPEVCVTSPMVSSSSFKDTSKSSKSKEFLPLVNLLFALSFYLSLGRIPFISWIIGIVGDSGFSASSISMEGLLYSKR